MADKKSHIDPDRLHRFMDDDDSILYQEVIPGPESSTPPKQSGQPSTTAKPNPKLKTKKRV